MTQKSSHFNIAGKTYGDFQVTRATEIPELQCHLRQLVHLPTGAQIMHIANDDPENLFCLSFQTLPHNSDGVAHVLEHTVLCGSKKYPVKDPFFAMTRRSLNTFMNALTGADFTCYPAASQVPKDFQNLLEVYLDAVFHPKLDELSFLQEGHRLEFVIPNDPGSPLSRKGIVYNEMKGAMSSANSRLSEVMNAALFPDLPYGYNSGGDPKDIPLLTYRELCTFHEKFYHPSRCLFFFYGNIPLEEHLDFIAEHALKNAKKEEPISALPMQKRFTEPKRLISEYPISSEEDHKDKTIIAFGWLTCHILKQQDVLALSVIEVYLMDTDASPLKLAFLKSGLCKQAGISMDTEISEVPIYISLKGCEPENAQPLEDVLFKTLRRIVQEGIPREAFEGAMHQLEFARSEIGGGHAPFGLSLFMRSALLRQHGGNPEDGLMIHSLFDHLRRQHLEDPTYLTGLIKKYLLDNPHFVRVTLAPSQELASKEIAAETAELEKMKAELNPVQIKEILHKTVELEKLQREQEESDIDVLPKLSLDDVPKEAREYALNEEKIGALQVFHHGCFTNEIIYADLIFDLPHLDESELPFVRLFTAFLGQMGCGGRPYTKNLEYIQANTGGVGAALAFHIQVKDFNAFSPSLYIRGKALYRNADKLFPLLHEMVTSIDFTDKERLKEVFLKHYTMLHTTLNQNAMRYAIQLASSGLNVASRVSELWYGLDYYWKVKEIAETIDTQIDKFSEKMQELQKRLLGLEHPHLVVTCSDEKYAELKAEKFYGLAKMATKPFVAWKGNYILPEVNSQGRVIAAPVAFTSQVIGSVAYVHPDSPALAIAASLFENVVLHNRIREQGGAYGGGASCNTLSGNFCFYAYRDPNIVNTLVAFEDAVRTIVAGQFDDNDLEEAKLEVIQGFDAPIAPGSRGDLAYSRLREGKTPEIRQAFRNRILALTKEEIVEAVKRQIVPNLKDGTTVIFGGRELLEKENAVLASHQKPVFPVEQI